MNEARKPPPASGLSRLYKAFFYSLSGLRLAFNDEAAFRQELLLSAILIPLCLYLPLEPWLRVVLIASHVHLLIAELLNTAIESIVDKVSPEYHHNAKKAKDTGSAAVVLALFLTIGLWLYAIITLLA